jgi:hypothetical protein
MCFCWFNLCSAAPFVAGLDISNDVATIDPDVVDGAGINCHSPAADDRAYCSLIMLMFD